MGRKVPPTVITSRQRATTIIKHAKERESILKYEKWFKKEFQGYEKEWREEIDKYGQRPIFLGIHLFNRRGVTNKYLLHHYQTILTALLECGFITKEEHNNIVPVFLGTTTVDYYDAGGCLLTLIPPTYGDEISGILGIPIKRKEVKEWED